MDEKRNRGPYELKSIGPLGYERIVSTHHSKEEALLVRDAYLSGLRYTKRAETFVVTHPDVEGYVEWSPTQRWGWGPEEDCPF